MLYLNVAVICASAFSLIWALNPTAFATLAAPTGGPDEFATMLYFSLTTLTTTGYGDIVPVDPFARSSGQSGVGFGAILSRHHDCPNS